MHLRGLEKKGILYIKEEIPIHPLKTRLPQTQGQIPGSTLFLRDPWSWSISVVKKLVSLNRLMSVNIERILES